MSITLEGTTTAIVAEMHPFVMGDDSYACKHVDATRLL